MTTTSRLSYFEFCPRGFVNEYTIYAVPAELVERFLAVQPAANGVHRPC